MDIPVIMLMGIAVSFRLSVFVTVPMVVIVTVIMPVFVGITVIVLVPVFVTVFVAMHMTVSFLFPVKISQVIFAFSLVIMAVRVFADVWIGMTLLGQFMVLSTLGFIHVGQRARRRQKEQNKWDDQHFFHSWISLQSALEVEFERELATYHRVYGPHGPCAVGIRGSARLPSRNRSIHTCVRKPRARLPVCNGNREDPFL
jgi:hypothetical protein